MHAAQDEEEPVGVRVGEAGAGAEVAVRGSECVSPTAE